MSEYRFRGREIITVELDGEVDPAGLVVPRGLQLDLNDGRARVGLFAFHVTALRMAGMPLFRATYAEALWRIAVRTGPVRAWWVVACDLVPMLPRMIARRWVRYPVRGFAVDVIDDRLHVRGNGTELAISIGVRASAPMPAESTDSDRVLLTGPDAGWRIPWGDDRIGGYIAPVIVEADSLSAVTVGMPVKWAVSARVRHDREHRCGVAIRR